MRVGQDLLQCLNTRQVGMEEIIIKVPTNYPSSQLCSKCGYQNKDTKNFSVRTWICPICGRVHYRDINASINIKNKGIEINMGGAHPDSLSILELVKLLEQEASASKRKSV